jgi:hypothetical protein
MRDVRIASVSCFVLALATGGLVLLGGCGESGSSDGGPATVRDAAPLSPEEQKKFDENYKKDKPAASKKGRN